MDLLGSILNNMDAPPSTENKKAKEEKAKLMKLKMAEKKKNAAFRSKIMHRHIKEKFDDDHHRDQRVKELNKFKTEREITEFIKDTKRTRMKFPSMERVQRSIVHDVAEVAGLTTFSFGEDELDRYVMLFKKEFPPSDEELEAYRNGEDFDPQDVEKPKEEFKTTVVPGEQISAQSSSVSSPTTNYKDKYRHLLGADSGKEAAKATKSNSAYGYVPSDNKRDLRSIEETLNDIRKRKKLKPDDADEPIIEEN